MQSFAVPWDALAVGTAFMQSVVFVLVLTNGGPLMANAAEELFKTLEVLGVGREHSWTSPPSGRSRAAMEP